MPRTYLAILTLCLFAAVLRLYALGSVPHGMAVDEAAIGYNGYAIMTTRRDEWLEKLPVSFRSFGDYKASLAIYINGFFTSPFKVGDGTTSDRTLPITLNLGLSLWAVRLPFALAGILAVPGLWWLLRGLLPADKSDQTASAPTASMFWTGSTVLLIIAGVTLAISPWHLHFTRTGFESGMALTFVVWGLAAWSAGLQQSLQSKHARWLLLWPLGLQLGGAVLLAASMYTYHSAKVVTPLLLGMTTLYLFWRHRQTEQKLQPPRPGLAPAVLCSVLGLLLLAGLLKPLLTDFKYGHGSDRLTQASIWGDPQRSLTGKISTTVTQLMTHLTPSFLVGGQTDTLRHGTGLWGVLLPMHALFVVIGFIAGLLYISTPSARDKHIRWLQLWAFSLCWIAIGLLPAAIGTTVPHSNRALLALPGFILLGLIGWRAAMVFVGNLAFNNQVHGSHDERDIILKLVIACTILLEGVFFVRYTADYYATFAQASTTEFNDGYLEALSYVVPLEKSGQVEQVIMSSRFGHPYIYTLLVRRTNPIWYQGGALNKYVFLDKISVEDLDRPDTIVVASGQDSTPIELADKVVYGADGSVRFKVYLPEE